MEFNRREDINSFEWSQTWSTYTISNCSLANQQILHAYAWRIESKLRIKSKLFSLSLFCLSFFFFNTKFWLGSNGSYIWVQQNYILCQNPIVIQSQSQRGSFPSARQLATNTLPLSVSHMYLINAKQNTDDKCHYCSVLSTFHLQFY